MNGSGKKMIIAVIIMLLMCIAAVIYIFALVSGRNAGGEETAADPAVVTEEISVAAERVRNDTDQALEEAAAPEKQTHIYSYSGTSDAERFTFEAYDGAITAGTGSIVLEMVVSASGTPYVADNDYAFDRTGIKGYFSGMSDGQIDGMKSRSGNKILKVSDVFDKYGDKVNYVIAVNYASARNISAFIDIVEKYGYKDIVAVECPYLDMIRRIENTFPEMRKIYRCQDQAGFNSASRADGVDILSVDKSLMSEANCRAAHDSGREFNIQTINSKDEIKTAIKTGVDSYFTDETRLAAKLEQKLR